MTGFTPMLADSIRGAATVQELGNYLFLSLKGEITYYQLKKFFPDSANIAMIYELTQTGVKDANLAAIADSAQSQLLHGWTKTQREVSMLGENWTDATFTKLLIQELENQTLPGKKITIECKSGKQTLRASAKCLKIGDRWFIGEEIKFGV